MPLVHPLGGNSFVPRGRNNEKSNFRHLQNEHRAAVQLKHFVLAAPENDDDMSRRELFRTSSDDIVPNNRTAQYPVEYCDPSQGIFILSVEYI
jgi:hypothetical protein